MYNPDLITVPSGGDLYRLLANCFLFFSRGLAVFLFPTLLADFKDPIQNRDRVPALISELHRKTIDKKTLLALLGFLFLSFVIQTLSSLNMYLVMSYLSKIVVFRF